MEVKEKSVKDVTLEFMKIDERATIPKYAYEGDMCMDLKVTIDDKEMAPFILDDSVHTPEAVKDKVIVRKLGELDYVSLEPGQSLVFHTGLKCATPLGWGMNIVVRSSVGIKSKIRIHLDYLKNCLISKSESCLPFFLNYFAYF